MILAFTVLTVVTAPMPRAIGRPGPKAGDSQASNHFECTPTQPPTCGRSGDQGDGTYANPVMPGDFSDLDAIRVGGDYYAISSTLQYAPAVFQPFGDSYELTWGSYRGDRVGIFTLNPNAAAGIWTWTHSNIPSSLDGVIDSTPARRTRLTLIKPQ